MVKKKVALAIIPLAAFVLAGCGIKKDNQTNSNQQSVSQLSEKSPATSADSADPNATDKKGQPGIPEEAVTACQNKSEGDSCEMTMAAPPAKDGSISSDSEGAKKITGTCKKDSQTSKLACMGSGGPGGGTKPDGAKQE